ncbi:MAG: hypothetical protein OHK0045_25610 [Raineya sp.]
MKNKLKKIGVLALVLVAGVFSQVGNAQEVALEDSICGRCGGEIPPKFTGKSGTMGNLPLCYCNEGRTCTCIG